VRIGIGDDAAVLAPTPGCELAVSVDMLVEGNHFFRGADPQRLGHKALAVNLSDMAAMGANPRYALLAGALPDADDEWLAAFMRGFRALAQRFDVELVGGDTTRGPRNLCVTILGEVAAGAAITRSGAQPGDDVYVSGALGAAALAVRALRGEASLAGAELARLRLRLELPEPRVALGRALVGIATAALDVSDGLTGDLQHILAASSCGASVALAALPLDPAVAQRLPGPQRALAVSCALAGGDDYELCFTAPPAARDRVQAVARNASVPCMRIGGIEREAGLRIVDEAGAILAPPAAFDHFA
jgi:thiamine-monophosphate kinase